MKRAIIVSLIVLASLAILAGCGPSFRVPSTGDYAAGGGTDGTAQSILFQIAVWCIWGGGLALALSVPAFFWIPDKRKVISIALTGFGLVAGGIATQFFSNHLWLILCGSGIFCFVLFLKKNPGLADAVERGLGVDAPGLGTDEDQDKIITEKIDPRV